MHLVHCTVLGALHCTLLNCTAQLCTTVHSMHCTALQCSAVQCSAVQCTSKPTRYRTAIALLSPGSASGLYKDFPGKEGREAPRIQHLKIAIGGGKKKTVELTTNQVTVILTPHPSLSLSCRSLTGTRS